MFPLFFQPIHVVWHHTYSYDNCFVEEGHSEYLTSIKEINCSVSDSEQHCPICEYKFSTNNLPKILFFNGNIPKIGNSLSDVLVKQFKPNILLTKSSRAPPYFTI